MSRWVRRAVSAASVVATLAGLLAVPAVAAATTSPRLRLEYADPMLRGESTYIEASGFSAGTTVTFTTDHGTRAFSGQTTETDTVPDSAFFRVAFTTPSDYGGDMVTITAADASGAPLASVSVDVRTGGVDGGMPVCAGEDKYASVYAGGLVDGAYDLHTDLSTAVTPFTSFGGQGFAQVPVPGTAPTSWHIVVSHRGQDDVVAEGQGSTRSPEVDDGNPYTGFFGDCFDHETLTLNHPHGISGPLYSYRDTQGVLHFRPRYTAGNRPHAAGGLVVTESITRRSARVPTVEIAGTTLFAGEPLWSFAQYRDDRPIRLVSADVRYELRVDGCTPDIWSDPYDDGSSPGGDGWELPRGIPESAGPCRLVIKTDGNLVLYSRTHHALWAAGTANTGTHNRMVLTKAGVLVVCTQHGTVIWTSSRGRIKH